MSAAGDPAPSPSTQDATLDLTVVIGAVTALVAGVGALTLTGALGRVQRNHDTAFALAIGCVVLGTGIIAMSTAIERTSWRVRGHKLRKRQTIQVVGMLFALAGVVIGFGAAVSSAAETERPTLDVHFDHRTLTITGTVTASNLSSNDGLEVRVDGLFAPKHAFDHPGDVDYTYVNLSRAVIGPDSDGKALERIKVRLPHGGYDAIGVTARVGAKEEPCSLDLEEGVDGGTACFNAPLPRRILVPRLVATWTREPAGRRVVVVKLRGRDLSAGSLPARPLLLRAVGMRRGHMLRLYRAVINPAARGGTIRTIRIGVPRGVRVVCAGTSRSKHGAMHCPIRGRDLGAVELHAVRRARGS
ncbi:MAG TPA: hypothetical protein VGO48_13525 [Conexibacter sp.]|jgi:hypothetical protein|nr:hypothetical protein [Conexibacter sp.]